MGLDAASIIGIGTAAAQLGAQGANMYAQGKTNRKTREFSKEMYERQKTDSEYYWNQQNEYNSPKEQMKRLKEAGLNPHLVYGNGSVANNADAVKAGDVIGANTQAPQLDPEAIGSAINSGFDIRQKPIAYDAAKQDLDNRRKQEELMDAQILETLARTDKTLSDTDNSRFDYHYKKRTENTQASMLDATLQQKIVDMNFTADQNNRAWEQHDANMKQAADILRNTEIGRKKTAAEIAEIAQKIINLKKEGKMHDFEIYLNSIGLTKSDQMLFRKLELGLEDDSPYGHGAKNRDRGNTGGERMGRYIKKGVY